MQILDPNEIKDIKKESADQVQRLVASLSMEEARLNKEVAILREKYKAEKQRIDDELEERKANYMGLVARAAKGLITPEIWKEANDKWEGANLLHNE